MQLVDALRARQPELAETQVFRESARRPPVRPPRERQDIAAGQHHGAARVVVERLDLSRPYRSCHRRPRRRQSARWSRRARRRRVHRASRSRSTQRRRCRRRGPRGTLVPTARQSGPVWRSKLDTLPRTLHDPAARLSVSPLRLDAVSDRAAISAHASPSSCRSHGPLDDARQEPAMSPTIARSVDVEGHVSHGFETVREAFVENFARRHELGGACCVYRRSARRSSICGAAFVTNEPATRGNATRW